MGMVRLRRFCAWASTLTSALCDVVIGRMRLRDVCSWIQVGVLVLHHAKNRLVFSL